MPPVLWYRVPSFVRTVADLAFEFRCLVARLDHDRSEFATPPALACKLGRQFDDRLVGLGDRALGSSAHLGFAQRRKTLFHETLQPPKNRTLLGLFQVLGALSRVRTCPRCWFFFYSVRRTSRPLTPTVFVKVAASSDSTRVQAFHLLLSVLRLRCPGMRKHLACERRGTRPAGVQALP